MTDFELLDMFFFEHILWSYFSRRKAVKMLLKIPKKCYWNAWRNSKLQTILWNQEYSDSLNATSKLGAILNKSLNSCLLITVLSPKWPTSWQNGLSLEVNDICVKLKKMPSTNVLCTYTYIRLRLYYTRSFNYIF